MSINPYFLNSYGEKGTHIPNDNEIFKDALSREWENDFYSKLFLDGIIEGRAYERLKIAAKLKKNYGTEATMELTGLSLEEMEIIEEIQELKE